MCSIGKREVVVRWFLGGIFVLVIVVGLYLAYGYNVAEKETISVAGIRLKLESHWQESDDNLANTRALEGKVDIIIDQKESDQYVRQEDRSQAAPNQNEFRESMVCGIPVVLNINGSEQNIESVFSRITDKGSDDESDELREISTALGSVVLDVKPKVHFEYAMFRIENAHVTKLNKTSITEILSPYKMVIEKVYDAEGHQVEVVMFQNAFGLNWLGEIPKDSFFREASLKVTLSAFPKDEAEKKKESSSEFQGEIELCNSIAQGAQLIVKE